MSAICERCSLAHGPLTACTDAQAQVMVDLLYNIANESRCKGCEATIFWVRHKNGKNTPYTAAGLNHFINCPASEQFRKAKVAHG